MFNKLVTLTMCLLITCTMSAQQLLTPSFVFSHKKTSYVTLTNGKEIQGNIKDIDRKKGLIKFVKIKDGAGKKHKLKAEQIKFMYVMPTKLNKLANAIDLVKDAQKWNNEKLEQDLLNQGYVYFELANVKVKKKNMKLLMQLLNPDFSAKVKVYHDPYAKETMSAGIGGVTLAGGDAKSYYIAKGNKPAYKLKKKDYKKEFKPLWKSCKDLISKYGSKVKWKELVEHIFMYSECSK